MFYEFRSAVSNGLRTVQQGITLITACTLLITAQGARADFSSPWTTVGSAGTPQTGSAPYVQFVGPYARIAEVPFIPVGVNVHYNVVAVDGLLVSGSGYVPKVSYADPGFGKRVFIRLVEYNLTTGASTIRMTFDSNTYPPSAVTQVRSVMACWPSWAFDFYNNAYYFEAELTKEAGGESPTLAGISIGRTAPVACIASEFR